MNRVPLKSSSILSAGYDAETRTLELEFSSLAVYQYYQVNPSIWAAFQASGSKGKFHANYLIGKYEYKCVVPRPQGEKRHGNVDSEKAKQVRQIKAQIRERAEKNRTSQQD